MREYLDKFDLETNEIAPENQVFAFRAYRFSVITPYLLSDIKADLLVRGFIYAHIFAEISISILVEFTA